MDGIVEGGFFDTLDASSFAVVIFICLFCFYKIVYFVFLKERHKNGKIFASEKAHACKDYCDVIIIGAGTAGCTLALRLNALAKEKKKLKQKDENGEDKKNEREMRIFIIDKEWDIKKRIIGELMQPKGVEILREMNLLDCITAHHIGAVPSFGYEIHMPERDGMRATKAALFYPRKIPETFSEYFGCMGLQDIFDLYPSDDTPKKLTDDIVENLREKTYNCTHTGNAFSHPVQPLAYGLHNAHLVNELRKKIKNEKNITFVEGNVTAFIDSKSETNSENAFEGMVQKDNNNINNEHIIGIEYEEIGGNNKKEKRRVYADLTCLCDGGASLQLRKAYNNSIVQKRLSTWVGVLLTHEEWQTPLCTAGVAHVVLCNPSPTLMYQISSTETRCLVCVDVEVEDPTYYTYLHDVVLPQLPSQNVKSAFLNAINTREFIIKNAYSLQAKGSLGMGLIAVGDAFNMRHAITGCGMTVTLNDVKILAELIIKENLSDPSASYRISAELCEKRRDVAGTLNTLANALHAVFTTPEGCNERKHLQRACFEYLSCGGVRTAGPIGLLSGLTGKPSILTLHFFLVVLHAMKNVFNSSDQKNIFYLLLPLLYNQIVLLYSVLHEGVKIILPYLINEKISILSMWPTKCFIKAAFPFKEA